MMTSSTSCLQTTPKEIKLQKKKREKKKKRLIAYISLSNYSFIV